VILFGALSDRRRHLTHGNGKFQKSGEHLNPWLQLLGNFGASEIDRQVIAEGRHVRLDEQIVIPQRFRPQVRRRGESRNFGGRTPLLNRHHLPNANFTSAAPINASLQIPGGFCRYPDSRGSWYLFD